MPEIEERRITLRLSERDAENISTIRHEHALRSESEAVRMALNTLAKQIRGDEHLPAGAK